MTSKQQIISRYKESIPVWLSQSVQYKYPRAVEQFVEYIGVKEVYTREDAIRFLNHVSSATSNSYARWMAYILKQFYRSLGIQFPLAASEFPPSPAPEEMNAPMMSEVDIIRMIIAVKQRGSPKMKAHLALSTTYGLRRIELATVRFADITRNTVNIHTAKKGNPRQHLIPNEVREYIAGYGYPAIHEQSLTYLFHAMQMLSGLRHNDREGFHSIRRSLVTELVMRGVREPLVYNFMRWKMTSRLGVMGIYTRLDPAEVDRAVFEHHPFLSSWET